MNRLFGQLLLHEDSCVLCDCSISSSSLHFFNDVKELYKTTSLCNAIGHRVFLVGSKINVIISQNLQMSNCMLEQMGSYALISVLKPSSDIREIHHLSITRILYGMFAGFIRFHSENTSAFSIIGILSEDNATMLERLIFFPNLIIRPALEEREGFKYLEYFCKVLEAYAVPNCAVLQFFHDNLPFLNLLNAIQHLLYYITHFAVLQVYL